MEKSIGSREEDGTGHVAEGQTHREEPLKKKKLVYFEIDNVNDAHRDSYEVPSLKIEELYCTSSKGCGGTNLGNGDGLTRDISAGRRLEFPQSHETCQFGDVTRMMFDEFGIDLIQLQNRILELEKQLKNDNFGLPPIFSDLKSQVENFRNKLETTERYGGRSDLQKEPFCQRFQYRRTSSERGRKIREKFLNICDKEISQSTVDWLKEPSFDSSQYEDEEILLFLQHMFLELGLISKFDIRLPNLRNFLYEVYKNYNEVPFHNFRHCFCVAQMMYVMIWSVEIPKKMGDLDTLILLTSCICHDLDHPGYNNIYQINARTELALLYNDISPLENHHCSVAFRILENPDCNIFASLDKETFKEIREGIIRCILATDMARHNEILTQFKEVISEFDYSNKAHKNLLSMILIKVADISNEARPMSVAEPWLDRLLTEFFKQSDAEKQEGLPVTPFMDRDKITKPSSQCSFIGFVLLPLFEALGDLLPELHELIITPARDALEHYRRLNEAAKDERMRRKSVVEATTLENAEESENVGMVKSGSGYSVRSRRSFCNSCTQIRQRSKSSEEFDLDATPPLSPGAFSELLEDLENVDEQNEEIDEEDLDEEPVTEVEVSEKTLKFKISTEGSSTSCQGRRSCPGNLPGSRKGSRERNQYLENEGDWTKFIKDEDGRLLKRSITSDTMSSGKGSSDSDKLYTDRTSRKGSGGSDRGCDDSRKSSGPKSTRPGCHGLAKYEYRRKSLAVVERPRTCEHSKRRSSIATNAQEKSHTARPRRPSPTVVTTPAPEDDGQTTQGKPDGDLKEKDRRPDGKDWTEVMLEKLDRATSENRCSRDFETSCWGLQNLTKGANALPQTPVILNSVLKNSLSITSKSEDNLAIADESETVLCNNLNVSKADETVEKEVVTGSGVEKKRKVGGGVAGGGGSGSAGTNSHSSLLNRLKQLKDRMSFSGRDPDTTSDPVVTPSQSACADLKTGKSICDNQRSSTKECGDEFERSRTLPKARKPHRTSGKMRKGWRALIGKSEGNSSSSLVDVTPSSPGSPSSLGSGPGRRKSSADEAKARPTGKGPMETFAADRDRKGKPGAWLVPSPKRSGGGLLGRPGRPDDDPCGRTTFLNNLTSSFRKRGGKADEEGSGASSSSNPGRESCKPN